MTKELFIRKGVFEDGELPEQYALWKSRECVSAAAFIPPPDPRDHEPFHVKSYQAARQNGIR
jgi:hypothetical protein